MNNYSINKINLSKSLYTKGLQCEKALWVHEGGEAMDIYKKLADTKDPEMISRYKSALIEYCKLDTLAMVKILQKLKEI